MLCVTMHLGKSCLSCMSITTKQGRSLCGLEELSFTGRDCEHGLLRHICYIYMTNSEADMLGIGLLELVSRADFGCLKRLPNGSINSDWYAGALSYLGGIQPGEVSTCTAKDLFFFLLRNLAVCIFPLQLSCGARRTFF